MAEDVKGNAEGVGIRDLGAKAAQEGEDGDVAAGGEIDGAPAAAHNEIDASHLGEGERPQAP